MYKPILVMRRARLRVDMHRKKKESHTCVSMQHRTQHTAHNTQHTAHSTQHTAHSTPHHTPPHKRIRVRRSRFFSLLLSYHWVNEKVGRQLGAGENREKKHGFIRREREKEREKERQMISFTPHL